MNPLFDLYRAYRSENQAPILLESLGPVSLNAKISILGVAPSHELLVREGRLYLDGRDVGDATRIFDYFSLPKSNQFFPAWMGFFSYEFARHFGLPTKKADSALPEAAFYFFEKDRKSVV